MVTESRIGRKRLRRKIQSMKKSPVVRVLFFAPLLILVSLGISQSSFAQWIPSNAVKNAETQPDGVLLVLETGYLRLQVCSESVVHVVYSPERTVPERPDFLIVKK